MSAVRWGLIGVAGVTLAMPLAAQDALARTVEHANNATVRVAFRARPGVCGNGAGNSWSSSRNEWRGKKGEWESECASGPVRVAMDVSNGVPTSIRFYVGGRWGALGDATDAGTVGAADAARYFGGLAEKATTRVAKEAIVVATLADSADITPLLLRVAKDDTRDREVRKSAVFWLGQAVGDAVAPLDKLANDNDEDIEVRKQAVFALSQRPKDEAVPALIRIARGKGDARVRKQAIFWLGQSGDPRAVQYFEDVLAKH